MDTRATSSRRWRSWQSPRSVLRDAWEGFREITRHSLALAGLALVTVVLVFATQPALQLRTSEWLMGWLTSRQQETLAQSVERLLPQQTRVTQWLSRKYKVGSGPLREIVGQAWQLGELSDLSPTLILAVAAVESGFNPYALGTQGALGLMQIAPEAERSTLEQFGGRLAAFDAPTNLRIGVRALQASLLQGGSVQEGLRLYAQQSGHANESAYVERVMSEYRQLERLVQAGVGLRPASPR